MRALVVLLVLLAAGCGGEAVSDDRTTVVAAFYPLAWAAGRVAGDDVEVVDLTPAGTEPHDLELTARDVERIRDAEVVLYLGGGFMPAVEEAVEGHENAIDLLPEEALRGRDPHVWLDPAREARITRKIATALGRPDAADPVVRELDALDAEYRSGLADCERRELVTSHEAFGYLADAYGLEQISIAGISPEAEPTPRELDEAIEEIREHAPTTVLLETLVSPRVGETIAREVGAETAVLDPLESLTEDAVETGGDYLSVMRDNLVVLREALGCR